METIGMIIVAVFILSLIWLAIAIIIRKTRLLAFSVLVGSIMVALILGLTLPKEEKPSPSKTKSTSSRVQSSSYDRNFMLAVAGESWEIHDDDIAVMKNPKSSLNKTEFMNNLLTVLGKGEKVDVIKTKGIGSQWKYCKVKGIYYGWILAETVDNARKIR